MKSRVNSVESDIGTSSPRTARSDSSRKPRGNGTVDVQSVARASDVLKSLAASPEGLSLAQISTVVDVPRSTVHRIILALARQDFVRSTKTGYRLGPALLRLAEASRTSFEAQLHGHLIQLSHELNETVDLSLLTGHSITFIDQIVAARRLRAVSGIGLSFPLYCTANGKALLAALPANSLDDLLPPRLERCTPATHVERATLDRELAEVRELGVAFDREEHTVGICAAGVALRATDGDWYAISVPMPAARFYGHETRLVASLKDAYGRIVQTVSPSRPLGDSRR